MSYRGYVEGSEVLRRKIKRGVGGAVLKGGEGGLAERGTCEPRSEGQEDRSCLAPLRIGKEALLVEPGDGVVGGA